MMKKSLQVVILFFFFMPGYGQVSVQKLQLEYGSHDIGFKHDVLFDSSRTYRRIFDWNNQFTPRPIPVSIWYPAAEKNTASGITTVLNYMQILKEEEEWEHLPDEQILNWFYYENNAANREHLKEKTKAHLNAAPLEGKFPTIIYAPSYQASSAENFALCEFLTSHGFVVISSPSRGTENRFMEGGTVKDMETQARDVLFLTEFALKYNQTDSDRIGTMGTPALCFAMHLRFL